MKKKNKKSKRKKIVKRKKNKPKIVKKVQKKSNILRKKRRNKQKKNKKKNINLKKNNTYSIVLEYFEEGGGEAIILGWESENFSKCLIPNSHLATPNGQRGLHGTYFRNKNLEKSLNFIGKIEEYDKLEYFDLVYSNSLGERIYKYNGRN